jgi:hypothetical protein
VYSDWVYRVYGCTATGCIEYVCVCSLYTGLSIAYMHSLYMYGWPVHVCMAYTCMYGLYMYVWPIHVCMAYTCMYGLYMYVWPIHVCMACTCMYGLYMYVWPIHVCMAYTSPRAVRPQGRRCKACIAPSLLYSVVEGRGKCFDTMINTSCLWHCYNVVVLTILYIYIYR